MSHIKVTPRRARGPRRGRWNSLSSLSCSGPRGSDGIGVQAEEPRRQEVRRSEYPPAPSSTWAWASSRSRRSASAIAATSAHRPHALGIIERAFQSTSDFPAIFQNVLNKSLLARYELMTPTYQSIAIERPFNDFRPHPMVRAGDFPSLQPVTETGELKAGASLDSGENVSVKALRRNLPDLAADDCQRSARGYRPDPRLRRRYRSHLREHDVLRHVQREPGTPAGRSASLLGRPQQLGRGRPA